MNVNAGQYFYIVYKENYNIKGEYQIIYQLQGQEYNVIYGMAITNCEVTSDHTVSAWD